MIGSWRTKVLVCFSPIYENLKFQNKNFKNGVVDNRVTVSMMTSILNCSITLNQAFNPFLSNSKLIEESGSEMFSFFICYA